MFSAKNIVLLTEINGFFDASLLHNYMDVIVFSSLEKLGCQNFNSRSVKGLESRFESILLAYSVLLSRAQRRFKGTLRYSLGY